MVGLWVSDQGRRNLDQHLITGAQITGQRLHINMVCAKEHQRGTCTGANIGPIDGHTKPPWKPATQQDIFSNRHLRHDIQFLMDKPKIGRLCILRRGKRYGVPVFFNAHIIGAHDARDTFDQGAFARPVFPHQGMDTPTL